MEIAYDGQGTHPERVFTLLVALFFSKGNWPKGFFRESFFTMTMCKHEISFGNV